MKISQLCRESGFNKSTIHYYVKTGLLDPPRKAGLHLFFYDESHLARLRHIKRLREQENLPLADIKVILTQRTTPLEALSVESAERQQANHKREQILDAATKVFSHKGYEKTTIADIANAVSMGRATFYFYFKDKRELFIECIERLTQVIVPKTSWEDIRKEKDIIPRLQVRARAFLEAFPGFRGILNLLRQAMAGDDPELAQKAKTTLSDLIKPMAVEHRRGIRRGNLREFDEELAAYFYLTLAEMVGFRLMMDDHYTLEEGLSRFMDFICYGIVDREAEDRKEKASHAPEADLAEPQGVALQPPGTGPDEKSQTAQQHRAAEVHLELDRISSFNIQNNDVKCQVELTLKDGKSVTIELTGDILLSGHTPFGKFAIPLKDITTVASIESE